MSNIKTISAFDVKMQYVVLNNGLDAGTIGPRTLQQKLQWSQTSGSVQTPVVPDTAVDRYVPPLSHFRQLANSKEALVDPSDLTFLV